MTKVLQLKYPTYKSKKEIWISAIIVATLVYLFLSVFQPFGTYTYIHTSKYLLLIPYALIAFLTFLTGDFLISKYFVRWTWKNEIYKNLLLLFLCSSLNYWYSIYFVNHTSFSLRTLFYMILFTYTLGIPVCSIYILGRYGFLKSTAIQPEISASDFETKTEAENILSIIPDVGEKISISKNNFLFARSEGNYTNVFFLKDGAVQKQLLRISLKNLEHQISDDEIFRCHRSYVLNVQNAKDKQGNAQGYKISLQHTCEKIPISRKYLDKISKLSL